MTKLYSYEHEQLLELSNNIFLNVVYALKEEKYLSEQQMDEILTNYSVILEDRSWLPKFLSKYLGLNKDHQHYRLVKAIGRKEIKE